MVADKQPLDFPTWLAALKTAVIAEEVGNDGR